MASSVRTNIRNALVYLMGTITKSGGYQNDVGDVESQLTSVENMRNFPHICVLMGDELTLDYKTQGQTFDTQHKEAQVFLRCYLYNRNDMPTEQDEMIQDVEKLIGTNHGLPNSEGTCTAFMATVVRSRPFGLKENKPNGGVDVELKVQYRQKRSDPTIKQ